MSITETVKKEGVKNRFVVVRIFPVILAGGFMCMVAGLCMPCMAQEAVAAVPDGRGREKTLSDMQENTLPDARQDSSAGVREVREQTLPDAGALGSPHARRLNGIHLQAAVHDGRKKDIWQNGIQAGALHKKMLAIVFLSPECPLCQNYSRVLNQLQERFGQDLDILGVFPGKSYLPGDCIHFGTKYNIRFLLVRDKAKSLVKELGARVTPEIFLLDRERRVLYHGAIDNWAVSLGRQRNKATENYLEDGIVQSLSGSPVSVKETKPVGCLINDF